MILSQQTNLVVLVLGCLLQCVSGQACGPGTFRYKYIWSGADYCVNCPANTYNYKENFNSVTSTADTSDCISCPAHSTSLAASSSCLCDAGYYAGVYAQDTCGTSVPLTEMCVDGNSCTARVRCWSDSTASCTSNCNYDMVSYDDAVAACTAEGKRLPDTSELGSCCGTGCQSDLYMVWATHMACTGCPADSTSMAGSTSIDHCLCNAGYYLPEYYPQPNTCVACDAGTYALSGSSSCTACPALTSSDTGATSIESCLCNAGYTLELTPVAWSDIPRTGGSGYFDNRDFWRIGSSKTGTWNGSLTFAAGKLEMTYRSDESSNLWGNGETYQVYVHGVLVHTFHHVAECYPESCLQVVDWPGPGEMLLYGSSPLSTATAHGFITSITYFQFGTCIACGVGTYKSTEISNDVCVSCESVLPFSTTTGTGSTSCECDMAYNLVGDVCQACATGYYKNLPGNSTCLPCPQNFQTTVSTASNTVALCVCVAGYTSTDTSGTGACVACEPGKYKISNANGVTCTDCSTGGTTLTSASPSPSLCIPLAGYYMANLNVFQQCPVNTYRPFDNQIGADYTQSSCIPCPNLAESPAGSSILTDCTCSHPHVEGTDGNACTCLAGYYEVTAPCSCDNLPSFGWMTLSGYQRDFTEDSPVTVTPVANCEQDPSMATAYQIQHDATTCYGWSQIALIAVPGTTVVTYLRCQCPTRPPVTQAHTCEPCPADFFCPVGKEIHACPLYSTSQADSFELAQCQCDAGLYLYTDATLDPDVGVCMQCAAGTFSDNNACTACPVNTVSTEASSSIEDCTANAGFYGTGSSVMPCPEFSMSSAGAILVSECECDAGYSGTADTACVACANGEYKSGTGTGSAACTTCPPDSYHLLTAETDASNCACNTGYTGDADTCTACPANTYKDTSGSAACTACADDNEKSPVGSTSEAACICNAGFYANAGTCVGCAVGKYKDSAGDANTCVDCPSNTNDLINGVSSTTISSAQSSITACVCPAGATSANDAENCVTCPVDTYKASISFDACDACPLHTGTTARGMSVFSQCKCNGGYTADVENGGNIVSTTDLACSACPAGTYKATQGTAPCLTCPDNSHTSESSAGARRRLLTSGTGPGRKLLGIPLAGSLGVRGVEGHTNYGQCIDGFEYVTYEGWPNGQRLLYNNMHTMNNANYDAVTNPNGKITIDSSLYTLAQRVQQGKARCAALPGCNFFEMSGSGSEPYNFAQIILPYDAYLNILPLPSVQQMQDTPLLSYYQALSIDGKSWEELPWSVLHWNWGNHLFFKCLSNSDDVLDSGSGAKECSCDPGFEGDFQACTACLQGTYKDVNSTACLNCPDYSNSLPQSTSIDDCHCNAGYQSIDGETCIACSSGKYKEVVNDAILCQTCAANSQSQVISAALRCVCNAGFQGTAIDGSDCVSCSTTSYKTNPGTEACTQCADPQHTSVLPHTQQSDCRCNAGFTGTDSGCTACGPGEYKANSGNVACDTCIDSTHTLTASTTVDDCICNAGFEGSGGTCTQCNAGKYSDAYVCQDCPLYTDSAAGSDDITDCICNTGYIRSGDTCDISCGPGFEGDEITEANACVACSAGKYKSTTGSGACINCPAASTHTLTQQSTELSCVCNQGYTKVEGGSGDGYCLQCATGTFNNFAGETRCYDCSVATDGLTCGSIPVSTVPAGMGVTDQNIFQCLAGTWNDGTYLQCQSCPTPSSNSGPVAAIAPDDCYCAAGYERNAALICTACAQGSYKALADTSDTQTSCLLCPPLHNTVDVAATSYGQCYCDVNVGGTTDNCAECTGNAVKYIIANLPCIDCPVHSTLAPDDEHLVQNCLCDAGFTLFNSATASASCELCADSTFKDSSGNEACTSCGANTISSTPRTARTDCACAPGFMPDPDSAGPEIVGGTCVNACTAGETFDLSSGENGACMPCAGGDGSALSVGTYKTTVGTDACTLCANPRNASLPGATAAEQCRCMHGTIGLDEEQVLRIASIGAPTATQTFELADQDFINTQVVMTSLTVTSTNFRATLHRYGASLLIAECASNCPAAFDLTQFNPVHATLTVQGTCTLTAYTHVGLTFAFEPTWLTPSLRTEAEQLAVQHHLTAGAIIIKPDEPYSTLVQCISCPVGVVCALQS